MFMIHTFLISAALCLDSSAPWFAIFHTVIVWIFTVGYELVFLDISPSFDSTDVVAGEIFLPGHWTFPEGDLRVVIATFTGFFIRLISTSIRSTFIWHCTEIYRSYFDANKSKDNAINNPLQPRSDDLSKTVDTLFVELVNSKALHLLDRLDMPVTMRSIRDTKYEGQFKQKKRHLRERVDTIQAMENNWRTYSALFSPARRNSTWAQFIDQVVMCCEEVTTIGLWLTEAENAMREDQVAAEVQQLVQGFQRGTGMMMEAESRCAASKDKAARRKRAIELALDPTRGLKTMEDIMNAVEEAEALEGDVEQLFLRVSVTLTQSVGVGPNHRASPKESAVPKARSTTKAPVLSDITNPAHVCRSQIPIFRSLQSSSDICSRFIEGAGRIEAGSHITLGGLPVPRHAVKASKGSITVAESDTSYSSTETLRTESSP